MPNCTAFRIIMLPNVNYLWQVLGIDPDLERLTVARDKYSTSNTQYQQASSENIPGQDYDIVFSNYVLHWVKDKHPFFHNVHKCLKPGGKFGFVSVSNFDYPWGMFSPRDGFSPEFLESRQDILFSFTTEEFVGVAATHHFETLHMQEDVREWDFDDVDKLVEYYMTHAYGRFDRTHFNIPVLQKYYEGRKISFRIPYVTTILRKPL